MCKAGAPRGAGSVPGLTAASVLFLSLKKWKNIDYMQQTYVLMTLIYSRRGRRGCGCTIMKRLLSGSLSAGREREMRKHLLYCTPGIIQKCTGLPCIYWETSTMRRMQSARR